MKTTVIVFVVLAGVVGQLETATTFAAEGKEKPSATEKKEAFRNIDVAGFEKLRAERSNVVLDVRTAKEFEAGHVPGAVNIDVNSADFQEKVAKLDRNKTYLVHCAAGGRSVKACGKLDQLGFPKLYKLEGGFNAWQKAGNKPEK